MKVYRIRTGVSLAPFGDLARDCLVTNRPLATVQLEALGQAGASFVLDVEGAPVAESDEHLLLPDNHYVTARLVREFIERSRAAGTRAVCAVRESDFLRTTSVNTQAVRRRDGVVEYGLRYVPGGAAARAPERPVVLDPPCRVVPIRLPRHIGGTSAPLVVSSEAAILSVDHWANLLCANAAALWARYATLRSLPRPALVALLVKHTFRRRRTIDAVSRIGKGCIIHPTAVVEGSVVGDNVIVGPNASVQLSTLGDGAQVGAGAVIEASVLGAAAYVSSGAVISRSVLYPGAVANARFMHASILGREAFAAGQVAFSDFRFDGGTVPVRIDGARIDTELRLLGACVGHRAYLGSGVTLNPGRSVPNDRRVVAGDGRAAPAAFTPLENGERDA